MRPNKDRRTEIILYGLLLIPLLFTAAALAQATEQAQGLAGITAVLSEILHTPSMLRWCASTPKFLLAVLVLYPLAVYCYMLDQADRHPGAEHGTAKWGSAHRLNIKYRNTKDSKENYILTENVRFSTDSHAHKHNLNIIVIGGSGSGKTRFYVKPNALQLIGSYLFLDPKGELTRTLGRIMETKGISVTVLDLVHFQGHYNPMAYLETDEDAIKLAFAIVNNTKPKDAPSGGDKFWDIPGSVADQVKAKNFSAGLNFGAGVELISHLQVGFNYGLGLTDNYSIEKVNLSDGAGKNRGWSITAAILF